MVKNKSGFNSACANQNDRSDTPELWPNLPVNYFSVVVRALNYAIPWVTSYSLFKWKKF